MSIREVPMYQVVCDAPDCGFSTAELAHEFHAWSDRDGAESDWDGSDLLLTEGGKHWCDAHRAWCPECESEEIPSYEGAPEKCAECAGGKTA